MSDSTSRFVAFPVRDDKISMCNGRSGPSPGDITALDSTGIDDLSWHGLSGGAVLRGQFVVGVVRRRLEQRKKDLAATSLGHLEAEAREEIVSFLGTDQDQEFFAQLVATVLEEYFADWEWLEGIGVNKPESASEIWALSTAKKILSLSDVGELLDLIGDTAEEAMGLAETELRLCALRDIVVIVVAAKCHLLCELESSGAVVRTRVTNEFGIEKLVARLQKRRVMVKSVADGLVEPATQIPVGAFDKDLSEPMSIVRAAIRHLGLKENRWSTLEEFDSFARAARRRRPKSRAVQWHVVLPSEIELDQRSLDTLSNLLFVVQDLEVEAADDEVANDFETPVHDAMNLWGWDGRAQR